MSAAWFGLLGSLVGALAGVGGALLTARHQRALEMQRWHVARLDESRREKLGQLQVLTTVMAKAAHEATFLTWSAAAKSIDLVKADAITYENNMRALLPEMFTAQANASGLSKPVFETLRALIRRLLDVDGEIGTSIVHLEDEPELAQRQLASHLGVARDLEIEMVNQVWEALRRERLVDDERTAQRPATL